MAVAPPGVVGAPPNFDDTGSHGMTPPRRLQPDDGGDYGQPAEGGGSLAINHANEVARELRDEMLELRSAVMANLEATKRDFDVKMSGLVGSEHHEIGTLKTLNDKIDKLEKENKDIKKDYEWLLAELETTTPRITKLEEDADDVKVKMGDVKDIVKIIKDDENITGMIIQGVHYQRRGNQEDQDHDRQHRGKAETRLRQQHRRHARAGQRCHRPYRCHQEAHR